MHEIGRIRDQLERAYAGEAWHGPSLRELLCDVTAERAAARPIAGAHSIWEIVLHLTAWQDTLRRRLEGERVDAPAEGDWPPTEAMDEATWQALLGTLEARHTRLQHTISHLDEARLDQPIYGGSSSFYVTLHGHIQHTLYHAGQIALLRRATERDGQ